VQPTSSVFISTIDLPSPARQVPYEAVLSAAGGRAPYTWSVESGVLPQGLSLSADGEITGQALQALGMSFSFVIRVHDAVGNSDVHGFTMVIVDGAALIITTYDLPPAIVGSTYAVDITAQNATMAPLSTPLQWSVVRGFLPNGMVLQPMDDKALVTGSPLVPGIFTFAVEVIDARGRSDTADFVLDVRAPAIRVKGDVPERAVHGQEVSVQFTVEGPVPDSIKWVVRDGTLPKGLALDESGMLAGTVAADAEDGEYSFTVGPTADTQLLTFGSYSMEIVDKIEPPKHCGCSGAESGLSVLAAVALALRRRRHSRAG
jgi:uncharacterized protein (TIGR03382 family)